MGSCLSRNKIPRRICSTGSHVDLLVRFKCHKKHKRCHKMGDSLNNRGDNPDSTHSDICAAISRDREVSSKPAQLKPPSELLCVVHDSGRSTGSSEMSSYVSATPIHLSVYPSCPLEELPLEILSYMLSFLPGQDVCSAGACSSRLYHAAHVESVWKTRCSTEYKVNTLPTGCTLGFRRFYRLILYQYGHLLGLWQPDIGPFGGMVHVTATANGVSAVQYHPPMDPHVTRPMRYCKLFTVEALCAESDHTLVTCHRGYHGRHAAEINTVSRSCADLFTLKCCSPSHHRHSMGKQSEFQEWVKYETNSEMQNFLFQGQELLLMKFLTIMEYESNFNLHRLYPAAPVAGALIQPGLFKGNYGGHGIEIIQLMYDAEKQQATGVKITGDPNVPAGEVSLKIDLARPMILTELQQRADANMLLNIDTPDLPPDMSLDKMPVQPFFVPRDCHERYENPPKQCTARFYSEGQIAGHGHTTPSWTKGHWMVFDADTFGHLWLELKSFSMYSRVKEDLT